MKFIVLSYVTGRTHSQMTYNEDTGREEVSPGRETTVPLVVPLDGNLRSFKKRKGDRVGTRLEFMNGSALPVTETLPEVLERIGAVDPEAAEHMTRMMEQVAAIEAANAAAGPVGAVQATDPNEADDTDGGTEH